MSKGQGVNQLGVMSLALMGASAHTRRGDPDHVESKHHKAAPDKRAKQRAKRKAKRKSK